MLRRCPHEHRRTVQGRRGSLLLRRRALPSPPPCRFIPALIAVGTALAGGPPHRSQRAELPHWAPASGSGGEGDTRVGAHDAGRRQPCRSDPVVPGPSHSVTLAATPKRLKPVPPDLVTEGRGRVDVAWHGVVVQVTPQYPRQPASLLGNGPVSAPPKLNLQLLQLCSHPLLDGDAPEPETSVSGLPTQVGKAQKVERLRFPEPALSTVLRRETAELDQSGLVRMQLQIELREPFTKFAQELSRIIEVLKPDHEIIGEPHDDHVAPGVPIPPMPDPQVENVVKVNVSEQRTGRCSLR